MNKETRHIYDRISDFFCGIGLVKKRRQSICVADNLRTSAANCRANSAGDALEVLPGNQRLQDMRELYGLTADRLPDLLEKYLQNRVK